MSALRALVRLFVRMTSAARLDDLALDLAQLVVDLVHRRPCAVRRPPRRRASDSSSPHAPPRASSAAHPMQTTDIRKGLKIQIDGVPYAVVEHQFVKPGKGQSFTRCRIKNLMTGAVIERTWKSGESVELADVETRKMTYSWDEGDSLVFMDTATGDQLNVDEGQGRRRGALPQRGPRRARSRIFNGNAIGIELPSSVVAPDHRRASPASRATRRAAPPKPATLSTGAVVNVPLFIKEGEWVKVDTSTGSYLERVNK